MPEADQEQLVGYFGFGSLVNKHTLRTSYVDIFPATLKGWRRHWQARPKGFDSEIALLSVHEDDTCSIRGTLVIDRFSNLPLVDKREEDYSRVSLSPDDLLLPSGKEFPDRLNVYVGKEPAAGTARGSLLQSYLDAVLQGFYQLYGVDGVEHFMQTTSGFDRPLISDRQSPQYPRHVDLSIKEQTIIDQALSQH